MTKYICNTLHSTSYKPLKSPTRLASFCIKNNLILLHSTRHACPSHKNASFPAHLVLKLSERFKAQLLDATAKDHAGMAPRHSKQKHTQQRSSLNPKSNVFCKKYVNIMVEVIAEVV